MQEHSALCLQQVYYKYSVQGLLKYACSYTVYAHMNGISQYHGMRLYYAWNTPVSRMEYACIMFGIRLYDAWNTPGTCRFHA